MSNIIPPFESFHTVAAVSNFITVVNVANCQMMTIVCTSCAWMSWVRSICAHIGSSGVHTVLTRKSTIMQVIWTFVNVFTSFWHAITKRNIISRKLMISITKKSCATYAIVSLLVRYTNFIDNFLSPLYSAYLSLQPNIFLVVCKLHRCESLFDEKYKCSQIHYLFAIF